MRLNLGDSQSLCCWYDLRCRLNCQIQARRSVPCNSAASQFHQTNLMASLGHQNTRIHDQELLIFYACKSASDCPLTRYKFTPKFLPCSDQTQSLGCSCSRSTGSFFRGPEFRSHFWEVVSRKDSPYNFSQRSVDFCWSKFESELKASWEVGRRVFCRNLRLLLVLAG